MKAHGKLKVLSRVEPTILISHYDLEQIRHVVRIAPQEAQWFHQIKRIQKEGSGNVTYHIYNMVIPEQECSAAQVETDPMQMVKMYKAVKANVEASMSENSNTDQVTEKVNSIIGSIGCWSHSHVNMGVSPSGTDNNTFKERIEQAAQIQNTEPQIMLIFNKKDDFFCRLYDPAIEGGVLFENVPIQVGTYDFSAISLECKTKMKERKWVAKNNKVTTVPRSWTPRDPKFWQGHGAGKTSSTAHHDQGSSKGGANGHTIQGLFLKTSYPWEKDFKKTVVACNESALTGAVEPVLDTLTEILNLSQLRILDLLLTGDGAADLEEVFNWNWAKEEKSEATEADAMLAVAYENIGSMIESEAPEYEFIKYGCFMALALRNLKQAQARRTVLTMWREFATSQLLFEGAWGSDPDDNDDDDDVFEFTSIADGVWVKAGADAPGGKGEDDPSDRWEREYLYGGPCPPGYDIDEEYTAYGGPG